MTSAILCNQCGAKLSIRPDTRFLECQFCGTSLKVHETDGTFTSEIIEEIQANQRQSSREIERLKLKNELLEIDQAWSKQREGHSRGLKSLPEAPFFNHYRLFSFLIPAGLILIYFVWEAAPLTFLVIALFIFVMFSYYAANFSDYRAELAEHLSQRRAIEAKIAKITKIDEEESEKT